MPHRQRSVRSKYCLHSVLILAPSCLGNWLTSDQEKILWQAPDPVQINGKHDRAMLALLLACGLRRRELNSLRLRDLEQREGRWTIVDFVGKGGHVRTVPIPKWVREQLEIWISAAGIEEGRLAES